MLAPFGIELDRSRGAQQGGIALPTTTFGGALHLEYGLLAQGKKKKHRFSLFVPECAVPLRSPNWSGQLRGVAHQFGLDKSSFFFYSKSVTYNHTPQHKTGITSIFPFSIHLSDLLIFFNFFV